MNLLDYYRNKESKQSVKKQSILKQEARRNKANNENRPKRKAAGRPVFDNCQKTGIYYH